MRINWFSNAPWAPTGYGNQTKLFLPRFQKMGHELSLTAFYGLQGAPLSSNGLLIFPGARHAYGQDVIGAHASSWKADCIISLIDAWVMQPENMAGIPWYPWFPIDTEPVHQGIIAKVKQATKGITMSKFGQAQMAALGIDTYYVPHGVDTNILRPGDREQARKVLEIPADKFLVGMVAANKSAQVRKAFYEQIGAFAMLKQKHKDVCLYLHTDDGIRGGEAVDLVKFCQTLGLRVQYHSNRTSDDFDVLFVDQYAYAMGLPDDYMCATYNAMDVLMNASKGEGFGIPLVEAQACGTPVITGDWTAQGELCFSGWKLSKQEALPEFVGFFGAFMFQPLPNAVLSRLEAAYEMRGNADYRKRARDGALAYDADRVAEKYWKPTLEDIERKLTADDTEVNLVKFA